MNASHDVNVRGEEGTEATENLENPTWMEMEWAVKDSTEGLSSQLIWDMAVRTRLNSELDLLLTILKEHGACKVVIRDPKGRESEFPCHLSNQELIESVN